MTMTIDEAEKIKTVVENKDYIVQLVNTIEKTLIEAFENLKIEDVNMFQLGYNKAIDDFVESVKNQIGVMEQMDEEDFCYCHYDYEDEYHDCLDYMECEECPYYYADLDQESD